MANKSAKMNLIWLKMASKSEKNKLDIYNIIFMDQRRIKCTFNLMFKRVFKLGNQLTESVSGLGSRPVPTSLKASLIQRTAKCEDNKEQKRENAL